MKPDQKPQTEKLSYMTYKQYKTLVRYKPKLNSTSVTWSVNAREKKWVFKRDLKTGRVGASLTWRGNSFHTFGAASAKALSPRCFNLDLGTTRRSLSADLSDRVGVYGFKRSARYGGAKPFRALYANSTILYSTKMAKIRRTFIYVGF